MLPRSCMAKEIVSLLKYTDLQQHNICTFRMIRNGHQIPLLKILIATASDDYIFMHCTCVDVPASFTRIKSSIFFDLIIFRLTMFRVNTVCFLRVIENENRLKCVFFLSPAEVNVFRMYAVHYTRRTCSDDVNSCAYDLAANDANIVGRVRIFLFREDTVNICTTRVIA